MGLGFLSRRLMIASLVLLLLFISSTISTDIHSVAFSLPPPPPMTGTLTTNSLLYNAERLHDKKITAPHSFAFLGEEIYAVTEGSLVVNIASCQPVVIADLKPRGCRGIKQCGALTSVRASPDGMLWVVDAYRGIFEVHPMSGVIRQLYNSKSLVNGRPSVYLNDLVLLPDGTIWISDSSPSFGLDQEFWIRFEGRADGRLLSLNPSTGVATEIVAGLAYPNGLEIVCDGNAVLVAETGRARIIRIELTKANLFRRSIFVDNLPGMPENIRKSDRRTYWIGLTYPRFQDSVSPQDEYSLQPSARDLLAKFRTLSELQMMMNRRGLAVEISERGDIIGSVHDSTGQRVGQVTEVTTKDGVLYVGTRHQGAVIRVVLPRIGGSKLRPGTILQILHSRCELSKSEQQVMKQKFYEKKAFENRALGVKDVSSTLNPDRNTHLMNAPPSFHPVNNRNNHNMRHTLNLKSSLDVTGHQHKPQITNNMKRNPDTTSHYGNGPSPWIMEPLKGDRQYAPFSLKRGTSYSTSRTMPQHDINVPIPHQFGEISILGNSGPYNKIMQATDNNHQQIISRASRQMFPGNQNQIQRDRSLSLANHQQHPLSTDHYNNPNSFDPNHKAMSSNGFVQQTSPIRHHKNPTSPIHQFGPQYYRPPPQRQHTNHMPSQHQPQSSQHSHQISQNREPSSQMTNYHQLPNVNVQTLRNNPTILTHQVGTLGNRQDKISNSQHTQPSSFSYPASVNHTSQTSEFLKSETLTNDKIVAFHLGPTQYTQPPKQIQIQNGGIKTDAKAVLPQSLIHYDQQQASHFPTQRTNSQTPPNEQRVQTQKKNINPTSFKQFHQRQQQQQQQNKQLQQSHQKQEQHHLHYQQSQGKEQLGQQQQTLSQLGQMQQIQQKQKPLQAQYQDQTRPFHDSLLLQQNQRSTQHPNVNLSHQIQNIQRPSLHVNQSSFSSFITQNSKSHNTQSLTQVPTRTSVVPQDGTRFAERSSHYTPSSHPTNEYTSSRQRLGSQNPTNPINYVPPTSSKQQQGSPNPTNRPHTSSMQQLRIPTTTKISSKNIFDQLSSLSGSLTEQITLNPTKTVLTLHHGSESDISMMNSAIDHPSRPGVTESVTSLTTASPNNINKQHNTSTVNNHQQPFDMKPHTYSNPTQLITTYNFHGLSSQVIMNPTHTVNVPTNTLHFTTNVKNSETTPIINIGNNQLKSIVNVSHGITLPLFTVEELVTVVPEYTSHNTITRNTLPLERSTDIYLKQRRTHQTEQSPPAVTYEPASRNEQELISPSNYRSFFSKTTEILTTNGDIMTTHEPTSPQTIRRENNRLNIERRPSTSNTPSLFEMLKNTTRPPITINTTLDHSYYINPPHGETFHPEKSFNPRIDPSKSMSLQKRLQELHERIQRYKSRNGPAHSSVDQSRLQTFNAVINSNPNNLHKDMRNLTQQPTRLPNREGTLFSQIQALINRPDFHQGNNNRLRTVSTAARAPRYPALNPSPVNPQVQRNRNPRLESNTPTKYIEINQGQGRILRVPIPPAHLQRIIDLRRMADTLNLKVV